MCGRYYFSVDLLDGIRELVEPGDWKLELGLLEKDMHPGDVAPVITIREDTARGNAERGNTERGNESQAPVFLGIRKMRWGFEAPGGKGLVFNARSESVLEKRMFRDSVSHRRQLSLFPGSMNGIRIRKSIHLPGRTDRCCFWPGFTVNMRMGTIL